MEAVHESMMDVLGPRRVPLSSEHELAERPPSLDEYRGALPGRCDRATYGTPAVSIEAFLQG